MNNKVQRQFDKSIREAVAATEAAKANKPRRAVQNVGSYADMPTSTKGRLFLCPMTGATVWEPRS